MDSSRRILIACRGVPARRIIRAATSLGMESAVLTGEFDDDARWSEGATYTMYVAPEPGGPKPAAIVGVSLDAGCDLVHPGWGWLARSDELAGRLVRTGLVMIGARQELLALAADRVRSRATAAQVGVPVVPGSEAITAQDEAESWLTAFGFPALAKLVDGESGVPSVPLASMEEAQQRIPALLAEGPICLERQVVDAREIEVLVVGNGTGEALTLGERETSVQPGNRRVFAESPVVGIDEEVAQRIRQLAAGLVSRMEWAGLVSVRFLFTPDGRAYLLRFRPGLQPWHGVTELTLGVDLVDAQLRIALGEQLGWEPYHLEDKGNAFCLRVFSVEPTLKVLTAMELPDNVRLDRGFEVGDSVAPAEEILQILVHAPTRQAAIVRARAALDHIRIAGVATNLPLFRALFDSAEFWSGPLSRDQAAALLAG